MVGSDPHHEPSPRHPPVIKDRHPLKAPLIIYVIKLSLLLYLTSPTHTVTVRQLYFHHLYLSHFTPPHRHNEHFAYTSFCSFSSHSHSHFRKSRVQTSSSPDLVVNQRQIALFCGCCFSSRDSFCIGTVLL